MLLLSVRASRTAARPLHHTSCGPPPPRSARGRKNEIVLAAHSRSFSPRAGRRSDEGALPLGLAAQRNPSLGLVRNPTSAFPALVIARSDATKQSSFRASRPGLLR